MFCTKCGKQLHDGDAFCAHCGTKVREELLFKSEPKATGYGYNDVVFNPPFKAEAERRTQHIAQEVKPYSSEPKREAVQLDWNLDGFPTAERKKNDEFEFNWDAVIDRRRESKPVTVEKILPELEIQPTVEEIQAKPVIEAITEETTEVAEPAEEEISLFQKKDKEEPLSIEELERALFGDEDFSTPAPKDPSVTMEYKHITGAEKEELEAVLEAAESKMDAEAPAVETVLEEPEVHVEKVEEKAEEKFYTYNAKKNAFQELLDKERERLKALEDQRQTEWDAITKSKPGEAYQPRKALEFDEVFVEPKLPLVPPVKEVAVVQAPLTAMVMAADNFAEVDTEAEELVEVAVVQAPLTARIEVFCDEVCDADETPGEETPEEKEEVVEQFPFPSGAETDEPGEETAVEEETSVDEKTKLRYSDVFPVDAFNTADSDQSSKLDKKKEVAEAYNKIFEEEEEVGGNKLLKAIIVFLSLVVLAEIIIIGAKFVAPDSALTQYVDVLLSKIAMLFEK